jgi:hypothetical protein
MDTAGDSHSLSAVIPAKAGIQLCLSMHGTQSGIPAFAGMTPPWG